VATNIVKHLQPVAKIILLRLIRQDTGFLLTIMNDGGNWDISIALQIKSNEKSDTWQERGRGIGIVGLLSSEHKYIPQGLYGLNETQLFFDLQAESINRVQLYLIEDDESQRLLLMDWLKVKYEVHAFDSAIAALEEINKTIPDIIVSNMRMLDMDGVELRSKLKAEEQFDIIPFIFLTASADDQNKDYASVLGIDDFLSKPIAKTELLQSIDRVLMRIKGLIDGLSHKIDSQLTNGLNKSLPKTIRGFQLASCSLNAQLGGGDYIFHRGTGMSDHLLLSDIMGHDLSAHFFSYAYAGFLRGLMKSLPADYKINQIITDISDAFYEDEFYERTGITLAGLTLLDGGELLISAAGHPAPLLIEKSGTCYLPIEGSMPGLLPSQQYSTLALQMHVGQRLCVYSDGLFELSKYEDVRIKQKNEIEVFLSQTLSLDIEYVLQQLVSKINQITGNVLPDDVTIILLEYRG
jgi:CheY-like chemotaxis protein